MVDDFVNKDEFKKQIAFTGADLKTNSLVMYSLDDLLFLTKHNSRHSYVKNIGDRSKETPGIFKQLIGAPMGSALAQTLAIGFGCAVEQRVERLLEKLVRPLFSKKSQYVDFISLFKSKRYIDDKINFYPIIDGFDDNQTFSCKDLEEMAQRGFTKDEIKVFRKMSVKKKLAFLRIVFTVYVDKDFYKTSGSTCSLEREKNGREFRGVKIDLNDNLAYKPMEVCKKHVNTPPNLSFLRDTQKKGFIIGALFRSGTYTDPDTWRNEKLKILGSYIQAFKSKGYSNQILIKSVKMCHFLDRKIRREIIREMLSQQS